MLKWTKDFPIETGFYWIKSNDINDGAPMVVELYDQVYGDGNTSQWVIGYNLEIYLETEYDKIANALWAGPIPLPMEDAE